MWRDTLPVTYTAFNSFEQQFHFKIQEPFREFLMDHNNGIPSDGEILTVKGTTRIARFLDFSGLIQTNSAWEINKRLRPLIGPKRIVVGKDRSDNYICLERSHKEQYLVIWSHITGEFDRFIPDIPTWIASIN